MLRRAPIASRADALEDRGIQEQMRDATDLEDRLRLRAAKEDRGSLPTKGELTSAAGAPEKPVVYTKTPGVRMAKPVVTAAKPVARAATEDLTPEWQAELDRQLARPRARKMAKKGD
jgi:hypothetical protein